MNDEEEARWKQVLYEMWDGAYVASSSDTIWDIRIVYSRPGKSDRLYETCTNLEHAKVRAVALRLQGFDVWQIESNKRGTTISRTLVSFGEV